MKVSVFHTRLAVTLLSWFVRALFVAVLALSSVLPLSACGIPESIDGAGRRLSGSLDHLNESLAGNGQGLLQTLQEAVDSLPEEVWQRVEQSLRELVDRAAQRLAGATACQVRILMEDLVFEVRRLVADAVGAPPPAPPPPQVCGATPSNLSALPQGDGVLMFHGAHLRTADVQGRLPMVFLIGSNGCERPLDENRIGRKSETSLSVSFVNTYLSDVSKVVLRSGSDTLSEVLVSPLAEAPATEPTLSITDPGSATVLATQQENRNGDTDYGPNPIRVTITVWRFIEDGAVRIRTRVLFEEIGADRTTLSGETTTTVWTAPPGSTILSVSGPSTENRIIWDSDYALNNFPYGASDIMRSIVEEAHFPGDDLNRSRVRVNFGNCEVRIRVQPRPPILPAGVTTLSCR